jgi:hypothetical protein
VRNPFKVGDKVLTKVQGAEVEAVVTKLWQNELQIRTPDKELRWRTMYTVWYPGGSPLVRPVKQTVDTEANSKAPAKESITPSGKNGDAKPKSVRRTRSRGRGVNAALDQAPQAAHRDVIDFAVVARARGFDEVSPLSQINRIAEPSPI